jgi:hypothetical protein
MTMKIILALRTGALRTIKAWRGVVISWFVSLLLVYMIVIPVRTSLNAVLGKSMITEKLADGLNLDALGDMGPALHSIVSSLAGGFAILLIVAVLANIFLAGGLFDSVKDDTGNKKVSGFLSACSLAFWPYLIITLLFYLVIIAILTVCVIIPLTIALTSDSAPEGTVLTVMELAAVITFIALSVTLPALDYARAWQLQKPVRMAFRSVRFGFRHSFKTLTSSFPLMAIMILIQLLGVYAVYTILGKITPKTSEGIFILFLVSQGTTIIILFARVLRYAGFTKLLEIHTGLIMQENNQQNPVETGGDFSQFANLVEENRE